jgi:hypothetical protein
MLCEISDWTGGSFFAIWMSLNLITLTFILLSSGPVFYFYYWPTKVTYQKWINKVKGNPTFILGLLLVETFYRLIQPTPRLKKSGMKFFRC